MASAVRSMRGEHPAELAGRVDRRRLVGAGRRAAGPPVDLDPAAHDDRLERPALGGRAEHRDRRLVGELAGPRRRRPAERLPHREVDDDVGVEGGDRVDDAVVVVRRGEVELGPVEPAAGRVGVDAEELVDPRLGFEQGGDARAEVAAHPADEHPLAGHCCSPTGRVALVTVVARCPRSGASGAASAQLGGVEDDVAGERVELAAGEALGDGDRLGVVVDQPGPADVAAHDPDDAVADLLAVDEHLGARPEQVVELAVERAQPQVELVAVERPVARGDAELVVVVEVVRRLDDRDDAAEAVLADPDDLLLAADPAVVVAVAAGPLADRELVLEDPGEVAGRDAERPPPAQLVAISSSPWSPYRRSRLLAARDDAQPLLGRSTRSPPATSQATWSPRATARTRSTVAASGG